MPGQYPEDVRLQKKTFNRDTQREACEDIQRWIDEGTLPPTFTKMAERSEQERGEEDSYGRRHYSNMFKRYFGPVWGEDTFEYIMDQYSADGLNEKLQKYREDLETRRAATGASESELGIGMDESAMSIPEGDLTDEELELFREGFNISQRIGALSPRKRACFIQGFDLGQKANTSSDGGKKTKPTVAPE